MDNPYLVQEAEGVTTVVFQTRDLVEHVVNAIRPQLALLVNEHRKAWILDLEQVGFLASAGLGLIVQLAHKVSASGGKLVVCRANQHITELFTGPLHLLRGVELYGTCDEAFRALRPH